jgi:hypothetical protein
MWAGLEGRERGETKRDRVNEEIKRERESQRRERERERERER